MLLTDDQKFFLSILRETGFIRQDQVLPLLWLYDSEKKAYQADAMLRCLRYAGLASAGNGGVVCLPELRSEAANTEMLLALDVLLALSPTRLLQISAQEKYYTLCFLIQRANERVDHFAFRSVLPGQEAVVSKLLQAEPVDYTFLLFLPSLEQYRQIVLRRSHYIVVREKKGFRFYKRGDAKQ